jgi:2-succinyl-5-enolpyruvyl-6-hydroxy-3-cyclohexene-1-carboxylate synthase
VAGRGAGPVAEEFAREGGWPLLAEVTSGAHFGPNLVVAYRELLREPGFGDAVERVSCSGIRRSRARCPRLVQREGVETIAVRRRASSGTTRPARAAASSERCARPRTNRSRRAGVDGPWVRASRMLVDEGLPRRHPCAAASTRPGTFGLRGAARVHAAQLAAVRAP